MLDFFEFIGFPWVWNDLFKPPVISAAASLYDDDDDDDDDGVMCKEKISQKRFGYSQRSNSRSRFQSQPSGIPRLSQPALRCIYEQFGQSVRLTVGPTIKLNKTLKRLIIRVAKKLAEESGILSTPNNKLGKVLELSTVTKVLQFYRSDDVSRVMAGKKNFVSVKEDGQKVHKQKRLILCNLKETYKCFKDKYPLIKISFSKFAELRPKECILPGANGSHSVCVCTNHENVKLLIDGANIPLLTSNSSVVVNNYKDALSHILCNPPSIYCYLKQCSSCPGPDNIIKHIREQFDAEAIEQITYKQWVIVDRTNLETLQSSTDEFVDKLSSKLLSLLPHVFIAQQQSQFLVECKENIQSENYIVIADFSENYSFVIQDSVQGVHWNNCQATIHPFVVYFKEDDYGIGAEWHFFATSHGKGPCDGIGGTVKGLATRASLQSGQDPITTPKKLFYWAQKTISNVQFIFCPLNKHKNHNENLQARYHNLKPITGTLKLHSFIPLSKTEAVVKQFSFEKEVWHCGAETWTLRRSEEMRIEAFEMWMWRRMERVNWTDRIRNEAVLKRVGEERMMLKLIRKRKKN
ncbi:hypothetical protein ANN_12785 [Periplaneta americana]|uniref:Uncharacterized protein n=1 Tax=Periplaneta americana TaxID=6978 RepID=A0ABQ8TIK1_PERAM|nr:hypothetical protein ANN_12785 [Periplaneta americana]